MENDSKRYPSGLYSGVGSRAIEKPTDGRPIYIGRIRDGQSIQGSAPAKAKLKQLIIPLPLHCVLRGIFLIIKLVQSPVDLVFFHLPPLFRGTLGMISLIIVIVFLALERILS